MNDLISSPGPKIPYDLLRPVIENLEGDSPSLCSVALSSSIFRYEAQRILFRDVATVGDGSTHMKFLGSIAASPMRLAPLVRAYRLLFRRDNLCGVSDEMLNTLRDALQSMHNLVFEVLQIGVGCPWKIACILSGCKFNLRRFNWHYPIESEADEIITDFLVHQHSLKHLGIFPPGLLHMYRPHLFDEICPQLVSLKGEWKTIKAVLPRHKITTLDFQFGGPYYAYDIKPVVPLLRHIKAFSYVVNSRSAESVLRECSSVSVLELSNVNENDFATPPIDMLPILHMLPRLSLLHTLILTRADSTVKPLGEFRQLARGIFESSGLNLECIDISIGEKQGTYARYRRSPDFLPEEVSESEVRKLWLSE